MKSLRLATLIVCGLLLPVCHAQLVIDSLDGDVTQHEVDTFINVVSSTPIPTSQWTATVTHNQLADGQGGMTLEAINELYEVTGDIPALSAEHLQLLNLAIQWTDTWLIYRNDDPMRGEQRVMWTGNVEPIWPPNCPSCTSPTYYESEVGDTVGHMAYTAYNILSSPSIWNNTVPDGDLNSFGATYLTRAQTYVSMLEYTMSSSFNPYFINPVTLLIQRPSTAQGYLSSFHVVNAWNVQFMLLNAYWRLAECHAILGDHADLTAMYQSIVQNATDMFVANAVPITAPDGTPAYDWGYGNFGDVKNRLTGEQIGVHASYDMWGLARAYASGYTSATAQQMATYADTLVHETTLSVDPVSGAATYAGFNDRCCSTQTYNYLPYGFIFLTPYNTEIYRPAANADISSRRQARDPGLTAGILWAKHWIFGHSAAPDFSLSTMPGSESTPAGGSVSYTVSLIPSGGGGSPVSLQVSGLPDGATASFAPASITGGTGSSTLVVATNSATAVGTYTLSITATDNSTASSHTSAATLIVTAPPSQWVYVGPDGKLVYQQLENGDRIMDFSSAGYMGGGVTLPENAAPVQQVVEPSGGDDTMAIQTAIEAVSALPITQGFRGMVLLDSGQFNISSPLHIRASGVVLSGKGSSGSGSVLALIDNGVGFHALDIAGSGSYVTSNKVDIVDQYVPSGASSINVSDASGFSIGDDVLVTRPVTQAWVSYLGMDQLVRNGQPQTWIAVGNHINTDRKIQAISGNVITLDVPLTDSFDANYLGTPVGTLSKYTFPGRISQIGVEHLMILAPAGATIYDAVTMDNLADSWMLDVVGQETMNAFSVNGRAKRVTLDSVINNVSTAQTNSAAPTAFSSTGTQVLFNNCQANSQGIWPFVTGSTGTGPTVVLNFSTTENHPLEPHQRWYTGLLTDNGNFSSGVSYINRRTAGSGHGWASAWAVAWNVVGGRFVISAAPGTESWCIGCVGSQGSNPPDPDGIFESQGTLVSPPSLYLAQLCERLGPSALVNIGYDGSFCVSNSNSQSRQPSGQSAFTIDHSIF